MPFSFREFLKAKGFGIEKEYLEAGGFPEVVKNLEFKPYVESLFNAVILKNVVGRYKVCLLHYQLCRG